MCTKIAQMLALDTNVESGLEIEDVHVNANLRWSCEKQKYIQIIIQNYNDNLHEHQNQTKYYHYSFNITWNQAK